MGNNRHKEHDMAKPIERHDTAAWANTAETKEVSNVEIPSQLGVKNAKEWVDTNQK
jgi:hypothetical protein